MAVVVSDTSPIRALAHIERLDLLGALFGKVLIPPAVVRELQNPRGGVEPTDILNLSFVEVRAPRDTNRVHDFRASLDPGEAEALVLALEERALLILIDEAAGRSVAQSLGLVVMGALGILLKGKQDGLVQAVGPLMARLENEAKFFVSPSVRQDVLRRAGESS